MVFPLASNPTYTPRAAFIDRIRLFTLLRDEAKLNLCNHMFRCVGCMPRKGGGLCTMSIRNSFFPKNRLKRLAKVTCSRHNKKQPIFEPVHTNIRRDATHHKCNALSQEETHPHSVYGSPQYSQPTSVTCCRGTPFSAWRMRAMFLQRVQTGRLLQIDAFRSHMLRCTVVPRWKLDWRMTITQPRLHTV